MKNEMEVVALLERFKESSEETRHAVRVELGWYDDLAAGIFALVVFVSDGLLQINGTAHSSSQIFPSCRSAAVGAPDVVVLQVCWLSQGDYLHDLSRNDNKRGANIHTCTPLKSPSKCPGLRVCRLLQGLGHLRGGSTTK